MLYGIKATINGKTYVYGTDGRFYSLKNIQSLYVRPRLATVKGTATMARQSHWAYDATDDMYYHHAEIVRGNVLPSRPHPYQFDTVEAAELVINFKNF